MTIALKNFTASSVTINGVVFNKDTNPPIDPSYNAGNYSVYYTTTIITTLTSIFANNGNLLYANIGNSVTIISNSAFSDCFSLISLIIPNSVASIGASTCYNCSALTAVAIPPSVTSIGNSAFFNCFELTSVTIPSGVTSIGSSVFGGCTKITDLVLPDSLTSIGNSAFNNCSKLTSINIPDSNKIIGDSVFSRCIGLTALPIFNNVTSIGVNAFSKCTGLKTITIPSTVRIILDVAFSECSSITSLIVPSTVTNIYNGAFSKCSSLSDITIQSSTISIIGSIFSEIAASVTISGFIPPYLFSAVSSLKNLTINNGVPFISNSALQGCSELTLVTTQDSVTSIGSSAFVSCSKLTSISLPNVRSIGSNAFDGCPSMRVFTKSSNKILTISQFPSGSTKTNSLSVLQVNGNNFLDASNLTVPFETASVDVNATPVDPFVNYTITGNTSLVTGNNTVTVSTKTLDDKIIHNYAFTITVNKDSPTITNFFIPTKNYGDASFEIVDPSSNSNGVFTYESSNESIADINGKFITITGAGITTITVTQGASDDYRDGSENTVFVVNTTRPIITNFFIQTKKYGNASFEIVDPSSSSDGVFTYHVADTGIATVDGNVITIMRAGESIVTVRQDASGNYKNNAANAIFTVNKATPSITNFSVPVKLYGDASFDLVDPSSNVAGAFTYESSDTDIATIDEKTVTIIAPGRTKITANLTV